MNRDSHLASWYHHAPYGVYQLKDAEMVVSTNPVSKLAEALNSDELRALEQLSAYAALDKIAETLAKVMRTKTYEEVAAAFDRLDYLVWTGARLRRRRGRPQVKAVEGVPTG